MATHPALADRACYHKYEIAPGLFTPGTSLEVKPKLCLDELDVPADLSGLRALDIGAWDGPYTFELERRGAEVTALDIQDPAVTIFDAVREILRSRVRYVRGGVYEASAEALGQFDLVLFAGVYYHLKNPALALQRIRPLLKDGGRLFIEGGAASDYLGKELAERLGLPPARIAEVTEVLDRLPLSLFDAEKKVYAHWSNWWFPTTRCLEAMLTDSGFVDVRLSLRTNAFYNYSHRRLMGQAVADAAKADPGAQQYEHNVYRRDPKAERPLPPASGRPRRTLLRRAWGWLRRRLGIS